MKSIEINGKKLQDVKMLTESYHPGTTTYLSYPKSQIKYEFKDQEFIFVVPGFVAVELYREGFLPQDKKLSVVVKESGKSRGSFVVKKLIYSTDPPRDTIKFIFTKK